MLTRVLVALVSCFSPLRAMAGEILTRDLNPIISDESRPEPNLDGVYSGTLPDSSTPNAENSSSPDKRIVCRGTSPFWTLIIDHQQIAFNQSEGGSSIYATPVATPSLNSAETVLGFSGTSSVDNSTLNAVVVDTRLSGVTCSDNMSEQSYGYSVFITKGGQFFDGCCWLERGSPSELSSPASSPVSSPTDSPVGSPVVSPVSSPAAE
jgi:uncharacterized membrane protein